jgi:hypothetical protein
MEQERGKLKKNKKSQSWSSFRSSGDHSEQVVAEGIAEMFCKVLNRAFSGHIGLNEETQHRKHCKPTILNLLHL